VNEAPYVQRHPSPGKTVVGQQSSSMPKEHYMALQENGEWRSYKMSRDVLEANPGDIRHKVLTDAEIHAEPQTVPAYVRRFVCDYLGIPHIKHAESPRPGQGRHSAVASVPAIDREL
jgi:hypothetical protein